MTIRNHFHFLKIFIYFAYLCLGISLQQRLKFLSTAFRLVCEQPYYFFLTKLMPNVTYYIKPVFLWLALKQDMISKRDRLWIIITLCLLNLVNLKTVLTIRSKTSTNAIKVMLPECKRRINQLPTPATTITLVNLFLGWFLCPRTQ